jgi:hypothetical protein
LAYPTHAGTGRNANLRALFISEFFGWNKGCPLLIWRGDGVATSAVSYLEVL